MSFREITSVAIGLGAIFMLFAAIKTSRLLGLLKASKYFRQWRIVFYFISFFILYYIACVFLIEDGHIDVEIFLTDFVLLMGALFVYFVAIVSKSTISDLIEANRSKKTLDDILRREEAEKALFVSEARYKLLTRLAPVGFFEADQNGEFVFVNEKWHKITGFTADETLGTGWLNTIYRDDRDKVVKEWKGSVKEKREFKLEFRYLKPDGAFSWVYAIANGILDEEGAIKGYLGAITDITEQKIAQLNLVESENKYRKLINEAGDVIYTVDPQGNFTFLNDRVMVLTGFRAEELIGKNFTCLIVPEWIEPAANFYRKQLADRIPETIFEFPFRTKDGRIKWVEQIVIMVKDDDEVIGFQCIVRDISERKEAQEKAKERTKELEAFSYSVSHDLRAPLRAINGYSKILEEEFVTELSDEGKRLIKIISDNSKRMGQLIDDLLAFSRLSRKKLIKAEINMNEMVNSVVSEIRSQNTDVNIDFKVGPLESFYGEPSMIKQVWVNLILNAVKYSHGKKSILIQIGCTSGPNETAYFVKDNGVGFDMKYSDKLFGVFQRLHSQEEFEGTGVGLAIVKRIIGKHNGQVWAKAKVNEGATFFFSIPH